VQRIVGIVLLMFLATVIGGHISSNVYGSSQLSNLTMADLVYDDGSKYLKISSGNEGGAHEPQGPIPDNQNEFAARVTDLEEENDNLSTEEEADVNNEKVIAEEDTASEENPPATKGDDDMISNDDSRSQSDDDNEAEEDAESQIPSAILQFIIEP
jgi:hypothetical protein